MLRAFASFRAEFCLTALSLMLHHAFIIKCEQKKAMIYDPPETHLYKIRIPVQGPPWEIYMGGPEGLERGSREGKERRRRGMEGGSLFGCCIDFGVASFHQS